MIDHWRDPSPLVGDGPPILEADAEDADLLAEEAGLPDERTSLLEGGGALTSSLERGDGRTGRLRDEAARCPDGGCRYDAKIGRKIGIICDRWVWDLLRRTADLIHVSPENWHEVREQGIDALLLETARYGMRGEWRSLRDDPQTRASVKAVLRDCRDLGIPTAFWTTRPTHEKEYQELADLCDCVCACSQRVREDYARGRADRPGGVIPLGVDPVLYSPVGMRRSGREDTVLWAGPGRPQASERWGTYMKIFRGVLDAERDRPLFLPDDPGAPCRPVSEKLYRLFDWAAVGPARDREDWSVLRAMELAASGALALSDFSAEIHNHLPLVLMAHDAQEVPGILGSFTAAERRERQMAGIRAVMRDRTCFDVMRALLLPMGLAAPRRERKILVLAEELTDHVREVFDRQSWGEKTLLARGEADASVLAGHDMVAWIGPDTDYGPYHLEDLAEAFRYTDCEYVTRDAAPDGADGPGPGVEHDRTSSMGGRDRTLFWREAFEPGFLLDPPRSCELPHGYAAGRLAAPGPIVVPEGPPQLSVVVPVYDNGAHLYGKCFASLRRSSLFPRMEIILVDDGSSDPETLRYERQLRDAYPNVRLCRFQGHGSGSASRPRNRGVELASAPYVTYLDPDNEAVCDGYAVLWREAVENGWDLTLGDLWSFSAQADRPKRAGYYSAILRDTGTDAFPAGYGNGLEATGFLAVGIQMALIRRDFLRESGLRQVEGAAGQDTLFGWQLLDAARRLRVIDRVIHVYYNCTDRSVTHTFDADYFRKLLLLQEPKLRFLQESGLLGTYMAQKFRSHTNNWTFLKLRSVPKEHAAECAELVERIVKVFQPWYEGGDPLIDGFLGLCAKGDHEGAWAYVCGQKREARKTGKKRGVRRYGGLLEGPGGQADAFVTCHVSGDAVLCRIEAPEKDDPTVQYACYLYSSGGNVVEKQMYGKDPAFTFYPGATGYYFVRGFVRTRDRDGTYRKKRSFLSDSSAYLDLEQGGGGKKDGGAKRDAANAQKSGKAAGKKGGGPGLELAIRKTGDASGLSIRKTGDASGLSIGSVEQSMEGDTLVVRIQFLME